MKSMVSIIRSHGKLALSSVKARPFACGNNRQFGTFFAKDLTFEKREKLLTKPPADFSYVFGAT